MTIGETPVYVAVRYPAGQDPTRDGAGDVVYAGVDPCAATYAVLPSPRDASATRLSVWFGGVSAERWDRVEHRGHAAFVRSMRTLDPELRQYVELAGPWTRDDGDPIYREELEARLAAARAA